MIQQDIFQKLTEFKQNFKRIRKLLKNDQGEIHVEGPNKDFPNDLDDLPLTLNRETRPGIKFYPTENSSISVGAEKEIPEGIDSFGEEDTFEPEEADEHQTNRDRNQNSDLSKRYYTGGMDLDEINDA